MGNQKNLKNLKVRGKAHREDRAAVAASSLPIVLLAIQKCLYRLICLTHAEDVDRRSPRNLQQMTHASVPIASSA